MGTWGLVQIGIDIFLALGIFVVVAKLSRTPQDDPRLSKGLQLLQSKIAVLEDLSDRTETQVQQLVQLLEQKGKDVQVKIQLAEKQIHQIRQAMDRSLEVAKIFQDKIPHQEIIERQNTLKYIQAARMAHQGSGADEIAKVVDLPLGEIEFIAKVNREKLMFNEDELPIWAKVELKNLESQNGYAMHSDGSEDSASVLGASSEIFDIPSPSTRMAMLGAEFRKACEEMERGQNINHHATAAQPATQAMVAQQVPLTSEPRAKNGIGQELQETLAELQKLAGVSAKAKAEIEPHVPTQFTAQSNPQIASQIVGQVTNESPVQSAAKKPVHVVSNRGEPIVQTVRFPRIEKPVG